MASMKTKGTVGDYLDDISPENAVICRQVRKIIKASAPELTESIKWGNPTYSGNRDVIIFMSYSKTFNVGFLKGAHMKDPKGLLEGTGKGMRHIKIPHGQKVPEAVIKGFIRQGLALDAE